MFRHICLMLLAALGLVVIVGCAKEPEVDPVSEEMQAAVAGSAARVKTQGRVDWEVVPERNQYWVSMKLENTGGSGPVAVRVAIKTMAPYIGIGESPTEPEIFDMDEGEVVKKTLRGTLSGKIADKAVGVAVEIYPKPGASAE